MIFASGLKLSVFSDQEPFQKGIKDLKETIGAADLLELDWFLCSVSQA
jgi:hypothetical protein